MSRKTTARRASAAVLAAAVITPGFALGIAEAAATDPAITGLNKTAVKAATATTLVVNGKNLEGVTLQAVPGTGTPIDLDDIWDVSSSRLVVELPTSLTAGAYDIIATAPDGTTLSANTVKDDLYSVTTASTLATSVTTVPASGGSKLNVTAASGLAGAAQVFVYDTAGALVGASQLGKGSDTILPITLPKNLPAGVLTLKVVTPTGTEQTVGTVTAVPVVTKAAPASLSPEGGQYVTVNGFGFKSLNTAYSDNSTATNFVDDLGDVTVKGQAVDYVVVSDNELLLKTKPASAHSVNAGDAVEVLVDGADFDGYKPVKIAYAAVPQITGTTFSDKHIPVGGGDVTLDGLNLAGARVFINGKAAIMKSTSGTALTFKAPPSSAKDVLISVRNAKGVVELEGFRYVAGLTVSSAKVGVADADAAAGHASGDTVRIVGTGFKGVDESDAAAVKFGTVNATDFDVLSDTIIEATVPAGAASYAGTTVDIAVKNGVSTPVTKTDEAFKYALTELTPTTLAHTIHASDPTTATVAGTNLSRITSPGTNITLKTGGGTPVSGVTFDVLSDTSLRINFPAAVAAGTYTLSITPPVAFGPVDTVAVTVS